MDGFIELTSHGITIELSDFHFCRAAASVEGGCLTLLVKYPIFPFPSIISWIDCAHSLKFFPFSFSTVNLKDELSIPLGPMLGMAFRRVPLMRPVLCWWLRFQPWMPLVLISWRFEKKKQAQHTWFSQLWPTSTITNLLLPFFVFFLIDFLCTSHTYI